MARDKEIKAITARSASLSNSIREQLMKYNVDLSGAKDSLPTDLGDIGEICQILLRSLEVLSSKAGMNNQEQLAQVLSDVHNSLYIHLDYHLKSLKRPLMKVMDELE